MHHSGRLIIIKTQFFLDVTVYWIDSDTLKREGVAIACRSFKGART